jgi:uncharacterized Rossmann fold enzyme
MDWTKWEPTYLDIVSRLGLDSAMDRQATQLLTELLQSIDPNPLLQLLEERIQDKVVVVCGAGPSLERHVKKLKGRSDFQDIVFVAADGAISLLIEEDCKCDIIVTDLDGNYNDIRTATHNNTLTIVHGHGDNMDKIRDIVPELGAVLGSTQVEPTERAFLWGGFTDGDRACYVVTTYSPKEIILTGMDFGDVVGKWSKPMQHEHFSAPERKRIKLEIARELITALIEESDIPYTKL